MTFYSKFGLYYEDDESLTEEQNEVLEEVKDFHNSIKVVYFAFTSLSTVGFGDLRPESDFERLLGSAILLIGVAVFSYIMGIFIMILDQYNSLNADFDKGDDLAKFISMLGKGGYYNNNKPMNDILKKEIEQHFAYRWENDKNQSIHNTHDLQIYLDLPHVVQNKIYKNFYFWNFLSVFKSTFHLDNPDA